MNIDWWGFEGGYFIGLPLRAAGYLLLGFDVVLLSLLILASLRERKPPAAQGGIPRWAILLLLALTAPILSGSLWIRWPSAELPVVPGVPQQPTGPVLALLGALPWLLAAGFLGTWQAMLVGVIVGLGRGLWETGSLLTPVHTALEAGMVSWLLHRNYGDWLGRAARHPALSALVGGALYGSLRMMETFVYSGGTSYDGLGYSLSLVGPIMLASLAEAAAGGVVGVGVRRFLPNLWHRPRELVVGPYRRSLTTKTMIVLAVLGITASSVVLWGDWLMAKAWARQMVERQMTQTANQAAEGIPFFIQSGRAMVMSIADEIAPHMQQSEELGDRLATSQLGSLAYFVRLAIFDAEGQPLASTPTPVAEAELEARAVGGAVSLALQGIPQETLLEPGKVGQPIQLLFVAPILTPGAGQPVGALCGWADLGANPMLQPITGQLAQVSVGEALVTDAAGTVLMHPDPGQLMTVLDLGALTKGQIEEQTAPDGSSQLVIVQPVSGYSWHVVVRVPLREVGSLSVRLTVGLSVVLTVVGLALAAAVFFATRRLTRPLGRMAQVAASIARGNLDEPVVVQGEDEIGRLGASFEHMRQSLKARLDEVDLLLRVRQRLASSFELSQVLPPILLDLREMTDADFVRLVPLAAMGVNGVEESFGAGEDPGHWVSLDAQIVALCQKRGQFVLENPSRARAVLDLSGLTTPIAALLALPIMHEQSYLGALWLGHLAPHPFTTAEVNLLSIIAGQLGASMAHAHLYRRAQQERLRLSAVLKATPDGVIAIDSRGLITLANPAAEVALRGSAEEAIGKPASEWCTSQALVELLLHPEGERNTAEVEVGGDRIYFASAIDIDPGAGGTRGRVCLLSEVTHYKKVDALKSEFVATVSHDLRAPLTLMQGYATMLSMVGTMNEQQKEYVTKILEGINRMTRLVDNVLNLGRIEAGLGLNVEEFNAAEVVREVVEAHRPQATSKGLTLEMVAAEGQEAMEADVALLQQAVTNLLDNAMRYTSRGGKVVVEVMQQSGRQLIRVRDTGIGIAPADQARLFEKFYRPRSPTAPKRRGSGLGLSIVKSIAEQHGGRIVVDSELGIGSTFTLDLPLRPDAKE